MEVEDSDGMGRQLAHATREFRQAKMTRIIEGSVGRTLSSMVLGCIGPIVVVYVRVFGVEVIAWGPTLDAARATQGDGEHMAFDELFAHSDVLSIHELLLEQWLVLTAARELELIQESFFWSILRVGRSSIRTC